ncbi:MAG: hypothetical protein RI922_1167 [Bacteroidota bacterium]|jgi:hypothetical protein
MKSALTRNTIFYVSILLISGCTSYQKIDLENIQKLYVDYNSADPINYSNPFKAEVVMKMYTSEEQVLSKPKNFSSSQNITFDFSNKKATLLGIPTSFDSEFEVISLTLADKNGKTITASDTIRLNFNAPLSVGFSGEKGAKGNNGGSGGTGWLLRDGKAGESGLNGANGLNGDNYEIHIWKEGEIYFIHLKNTTENWTAKYKMMGTHALVINSQGGNGGNGGEGGSGGSGKDGELKGTTTQLPGNGGNGGNGGNAGNGGRGGDIMVVINPNAEAIKPFLEIRNIGGFAGNAGSGGTGGQPGKPLSGQSQGKSGSNGLNGMNGLSGQAGTINVQTTPFDPITYK